MTDRFKFQRRDRVESLERERVSESLNVYVIRENVNKQILREVLHE